MGPIVVVTPAQTEVQRQVFPGDGNLHGLAVPAVARVEHGVVAGRTDWEDVETRRVDPVAVVHIRGVIASCESRFASRRHGVARPRTKMPRANMDARRVAGEAQGNRVAFLTA